MLKQAVALTQQKSLPAAASTLQKYRSKTKYQNNDFIFYPPSSQKAYISR